MEFRQSLETVQVGETALELRSLQEIMPTFFARHLAGRTETLVFDHVAKAANGMK